MSVIGIVIFRQNIITKENTGKGHASEIAKSLSAAGIDISNINIGSYIDYTVPNTNTYTANSDQTGLDGEKTYTASSLKWRVLSKDEESNTIEIISAKEDENTFALKGFKGYNNGVKILNDACNTLYVNTEKGAVSARNLKIEDIEAHHKAGERKASEREFTLTNKYYPEIFANEVNGSIAKSNQDEFVSQTGEKSGNINGKITFYGFAMSTFRMDNQTSIDLFSCTEGKLQWLSSRCVDYANNTAYFALSYITGSYIGNGILYNSENNLETYECNLRPVATIDLNKAIIGNGGSGTKDDPYGVEEKTKPGLPIESLEVGKYVAYNPLQEIKGTPNEFEIQTIYSGYNREQTYEQDTSEKWRILSKTEDTIELISSSVTKDAIWLSNYQGYNNAVALLNNVAKALYSNENLEAIARSLNMEDIEKYYTGTKPNPEADKEYTPTYKYYPAIFEVERWGSIDGSYKGSVEKSQMPTSGIDELQKDGYILQNNIKKGNTLKVKITAYDFTMSENTMGTQFYVDLFKTPSYNHCFLASRCVYYASNVAHFRVFGIGDIKVSSDHMLYRSDDSRGSVHYALRPIITLNPKSIAIGNTGSGTVNSPYSIEKI